MQSRSLGEDQRAMQFWDLTFFQMVKKVILPHWGPLEVRSQVA